jgi:hypothetical protein
MTLPAYARGKDSQQVTDHGAVERAFRQGLPPGWGPIKISISYAGRDAKGRSVYNIRYTPPPTGSQQRSRLHTATYAFDGSRNGLVPPSKFTGVKDPSKTEIKGPQPPAQDQTARHLASLRSRIISWINNNSSLLSRDQRNSYMRQVNQIDDYGRLNQWFGLIQSSLPLDRGIHAEWQPDDTGLDPWAGFGGGGGGGGFAGPEYVAPDRRVVEDMVSGMLTSLIGEVEPGILKSMTDLYMKDHRRNFDSPNQEIDPSMSVLEGIRQTRHYQTAHALRPDTEDERSWIGNRIALAKRGGLNTGLTQAFGVTQATAGVDEAEIEDAAAAHQTQASGSVRGTSLEDRMREATQNMFRNVVV